MEMTQHTPYFIQVFFILSTIFLVVCHWKLFEKAGRPGWAAIIPIYNLIVLLEIAGKPAWWIVLLLIPFVNIVVYILMIDGVSRSFGKDFGFTMALICLGFVFLPILAFGDAEYLGPVKGLEEQRRMEKDLS
jgi:hypothetical protein